MVKLYIYIGALHRARGGPDRYIVCFCFYLLLFMLRYLLVLILFCSRSFIYWTFLRTSDFPHLAEFLTMYPNV